MCATDMHWSNKRLACLDRQTNKMYKRFIRSFYSDHRHSLQFPIIHDVHWQTTVNDIIFRLVLLTTTYFIFL